VIEVTAVSNTGDPARSPRGATLQALLAFAGGARATYTATYESSGHQFFEGGQEFYERITGEDATLHMFHRWLVLCPNGRLPRMVRRGPRELSEERALLGEFEKAMQGDPHGCSGRDNLKTMAVVEACMRSSLERRAIDPRGLLA
jgi:predicted dehydrogenase